jgi:hypothetical protein
MLSLLELALTIIVAVLFIALIAGRWVMGMLQPAPTAEG